MGDHAPAVAKASIRDFLQRKVLKDRTLRDDESFWETRAVDSLGIMQLIHFLETRFGISIPGRDMTSETFRSIDSVHAYVMRRIGEGTRRGSQR